MFRFIAIAILGLSSLAMNAPWQHEMLIADEGGNKVWYVNPADATKNWSVNVTENRSMQLIGNNRLLVSTLTGFVELDLANKGATLKTYNLPKASGAGESAYRMPSGDTWVFGEGLMNKPGTVCVRVNAAGTAILDTFSVKDSSGQVCGGATRYCNISKRGTFYCGNSGGDIYEVDTLRHFLGRIPAAAFPNLSGGAGDHAYLATDWGVDTVVVSIGFGYQTHILKKTGKTYSSIRKINGATAKGDSVKPNFFGGYQILANGNIVQTNWVGHGPAGPGSGIQVLEYDKTGALVSCWRQGAMQAMSAHGILILDGLNTMLLHDSRNGPLMPVTGVTGMQHALAPYRVQSRSDHEFLSSVMTLNGRLAGADPSTRPQGIFFVSGRENASRIVLPLHR